MCLYTLAPVVLGLGDEVLCALCAMCKKKKEREQREWFGTSAAVLGVGGLLGLPLLVMMHNIVLFYFFYYEQLWWPLPRRKGGEGVH